MIRYEKRRRREESVCMIEREREKERDREGKIERVIHIYMLIPEALGKLACMVRERE